jgi:hypothetical protein
VVHYSPAFPVITCFCCSTLSFGGSKVRLHLEVYADKDQRPVLRE